MRRIAIIIVLVLQVVLDPSKLWADELKVGVILGLTGYANVWADYSRKGLELAVSETNAEPSRTRTIRLLFEDSKSTSVGAVSAFNKLVHVDKVEVVVGDVWAFLTIPLIPLAARERIVLISPTVMDKSVPEVNDYYFSLGHRFESLRKPIEKFFTLHPHIRRVGTISFDDYWNDAFVETFNEAARRANAQIVKTVKVNDFNPDFKTEVATVRREKADTLLTTWKPEIALQRMKEQKFEVPYICSSDTVEAFLFRSRNKALFEGSYFVDWVPSDEFSRKFEARYGSRPLYEAQNSYEVIRSIFRAANSGDSDLRQSLANVSYDGVGGRIDFTKSQFPNLAEARLYRIEDGVFKEQ